MEIKLTGLPGVHLAVVIVVLCQSPRVEISD